jgi:proline racemase
MPELERIKNGFFNRYPDRITTIDSHTQGEPTRLLVGGVGDLPGPTIKDKKTISNPILIICANC